MLRHRLHKVPSRLGQNPCRAGHRPKAPRWTWSLLLVLGGAIGCSAHLEPRNMPAMRRRGYNTEFFSRHKTPYEAQASIHIAHAVQHDLLQLEPLAQHERIDVQSNARYLADFHHPPRIGPKMMPFGPHAGQGIWRLYQAIDWTHEHHDQTYDILADADIPWSEKGRVTAASVEWYLEKLRGTARSPAPLDVTLRRAGVMMKPYATIFRNNYPKSAKYFFFAHWWHPAMYEAMMIAGNDREQEQSVNAAHGLSEQVLAERPERMLLSREIMPRYSRMSPESANIFDNLHMLHGIAYDILAYEGWTIDEKRAELYRVIDAMSEKPGDRELARRFPEPYADMDPRCYEPWMRGMDGEMSRIMREMLQDMWPMMSPDGQHQLPPQIAEHLRLKMTPGMQPGELPGSLHDALMALVPNMKMNADSMKPGVSDPAMMKMMLDGWRRRTANLADVPAFAMTTDPMLPPKACLQTAALSAAAHSGSEVAP
jgi:hypothetical protein